MGELRTLRGARARVASQASFTLQVFGFVDIRGGFRAIHQRDRRQLVGDQAAGPGISRQFAHSGKQPPRKYRRHAGRARVLACRNLLWLLPPGRLEALQISDTDKGLVAQQDQDSRGGGRQCMNPAGER